MNAINSSDTDSKICACSGTSKQQIQRLVEKGMNSFEEITRMSGASTGCGACETAIRECLAVYSSLSTHLPLI